MYIIQKQVYLWMTASMFSMEARSGLSRPFFCSSSMMAFLQRGTAMSGLPFVCVCGGRGWRGGRERKRERERENACNMLCCGTCGQHLTWHADNHIKRDPIPDLVVVNLQTSFCTLERTHRWDEIFMANKPTCTESCTMYLYGGKGTGTISKHFEARVDAVPANKGGYQSYHWKNQSPGMPTNSLLGYEIIGKRELLELMH